MMTMGLQEKGAPEMSLTTGLSLEIRLETVQREHAAASLAFRSIYCIWFSGWPLEWELVLSNWKWELPLWGVTGKFLVLTVHGKLIFVVHILGIAVGAFLNHVRNYKSNDLIRLSLISTYAVDNVCIPTMFPFQSPNSFSTCRFCLQQTPWRRKCHPNDQICPTK